MNSEQLQILQHSIGADQYGRIGLHHRNYFVASGKDAETCRELVGLGFMIEHKPYELSGNDPWFTVTVEGKTAVFVESPKAPPPEKLTRSKRRYRAWLKSGLGMTFFEFIKWTSKDADARKAYGI